MLFRFYNMIDSQLGIISNVSLYMGDFTFKEFEAFTEEQKESYLADRGHNLVVDNGLQQIILLMIANNTNSFTLCGVGSGTTTPISTDTALATSIGTNTINSRYRVGNIAYFNTFFGKNDNNGTWAETGIFTAGSVLLCRRKYDTVFTKDTSKAAVISWTITLTATAD